MSAIRRTLSLSAAALLGFGAWGGAQELSTDATAPGTAAPHTIVVKLLERPGQSPQFAFEPATFTAHHGDTLRFVQAAATMHNVHIKRAPKGARLGAAAMSDYLIAKGQSYTLLVDSRFTEGAYEIVCDPHETIGMHAILTVIGAPQPGTSK